MNLPPIIGLCGDIGSGKSSVAGHLANVHGYTERSFATKLKEVAADVYELTPKQVWTQAGKAEPVDHVVSAAGERQTPRRILEWLGTEGFRTLDPDTWVKYLMREIDKARDRWTSGCPYERPPVFVVGDCRFPNEFAAIRERGGVIWKTVRAGGEAAVRTGHASDELWRSEPVDAILFAQAGDLAGLFEQADAVLAAGGIGHTRELPTPEPPA